MYTLRTIFSFLPNTNFIGKLDVDKKILFSAQQPFLDFLIIYVGIPM